MAKRQSYDRAITPVEYTGLAELTTTSTLSYSGRRNGALNAFFRKTGKIASRDVARSRINWISACQHRAA